MGEDVFVEKIENLVNEFTKNIDKDCMEINGKDCRILFKKKEIINDPQYGIIWREDVMKPGWHEDMMKPGYKLTYCSCCGKPIYYDGTFTPTRCSNCEN